VFDRRREVGGDAGAVVRIEFRPPVVIEYRVDGRDLIAAVEGGRFRRMDKPETDGTLPEFSQRCSLSKIEFTLIRILS
jgi:hypothetical protein